VKEYALELVGTLFLIFVGLARATVRPIESWGM
jgi:hypothetical protein